MLKLFSDLLGPNEDFNFVLKVIMTTRHLVPYKSYKEETSDTYDFNADCEDVFDNFLQKKFQEKIIDTYDSNTDSKESSHHSDEDVFDHFFHKKLPEDATLNKIPRTSYRKYKSVLAKTLRDKEMPTYAFPPNTTHALIIKYMEYLNVMKCSKENRLFQSQTQFSKTNSEVKNKRGKALLRPQFSKTNSEVQNKTRKALLQPQIADCSTNNSNSTKHNAVSSTNPLSHDASCNAALINFRSSVKSIVENNCLKLKDPKFSKRHSDSVATVLTKSTTSTDYSIPDANEGCKGARRKGDVLIQDKDPYSNKDTTKACKKETYIIDEQYTYLSGIFPDADSTYLKKVIQRMNGNQDALLQFIQTQCEQPTYPTKEEKLKRLQISKQQKQLVFQFDVKQFLEIFPDPFTHFEDPSRQCKYKKDGYNFLMSHFKQFKEDDLTELYKSQKYHLSLTAKMLEHMVPDIITPDRNIKLWEKYYLSVDIPLLQECAFITHKVKIREYMDKLRETEQLEFAKLKFRNELLECECCFDDECMPLKCSTCDDGHVFCNPCIIKGVELKIAQGETRISCFSNCTGEFSLPTLQRILKPTQFSILISKKQEAEVLAAGLEGLVSCPFCHFASIPPAEDKIFKCLNPECMKESCRSCKKIDHAPLPCHYEKMNKARLFVEEKMTEALVRKCYNCARPYFKIDGCNKITCPCGAIMCYLCDKAVTGYNHFHNGSQMRGLCPLWSNNDEINNDIVEAVGKKALEYVTNKDRDVKLNESHFLRHNSSTTSRNSVDAGTLQERLNKLTTFDT